MRILLLFNNTHAVIKAEHTIAQLGVQHFVKPVPSSISSQCGMCIEIVDLNDEHIIKQAFQKEQIEFRLVTINF